MDAKEIVARLEIVKLAISINDHSTIILQTKHLIRVNSSRLNEISALLNGKNYRQALYLIKSYLNEMGDTNTLERFEFEGEGERVLDIEDMLRMSPLAKETIKDYKRSIYTKDDLEAFAKKIVISPTNDNDSVHKSKYNDNVVNFNNKEDESKELKTENEKIEENKTQEPKVEIIKKDSGLVESIEEEFKEIVEIKKEEPKEPTQEELQKSKELAKALEKADSETPLDEISSEVLGSKTKSSRAKVLSKYKALREKFAKKTLKAKNNEIKDLKTENITSSSDKTDEPKKEIEDNTNLNKNIDKVDTKTTNKLSKEEQIAQDKIDRDTIYSPIPHIEEKFRQSFVLYPPLKDSEVWVEEVIRFLKYIAKNSFTERDVKQLLDEYNFYLEKRDIAKASQVLLLAASTESKYAKFLLARELFSGRVIKRDLKKSFELMKELANSFYAEAVCDLGQFYEYGIGVSKDKKVALRLYEKAFELGSSRATKHINRLKESNSIFSTIFRFK